MRKRLEIVGALLLAATAAATGCSSDSPATGTGGQSGGTGGQSATGGVGGSVTGGSGGSGGSSGGALTCTNVSPCGGNVVGTWNVTSSCLQLSGPMDVSLASLGCTTVPATGSLQTTGSLVADGNGTYTDNTTTTGTVTFPLAPSCLSISSVDVECSRVGSIFSALGWTTSTCTDTNGQCNCSLSAVQHAGLGTVSPYTEPNGSYTTSATTLTIDPVTYSYCVSGSTLTVTPQMSALTGTVVLQMESSAGGAGGTAGAGGAAGTAGVAGSGGVGAAGGASGMGGMGGVSATGGVSGAAGGGMAGASGATGGAGAGGGAAGATGGSSGASGSAGMSTGPCDIYEAASHMCVAAHSTIRALYGSFGGALYQVKRASDSTTKDIPALSPGGVADSAQQDTFCSGTTCTITKVYDQSGHGNFIEAETPDSSVMGHSGQTAANATGESLNVGGHKVYSLYTRPSQAYWRDGSKTGMPLGNAPQGIYIVTSGTHFNSGCCYDYGNAEVSRTYVAGATMDSLYFGNSTTWGSGNGSGPWVMADLEGGIFSQGSSGKNNNLMSQTSTYVTAVEKNNGTTEFALKAANATTGNLTTYYKGSLPPGKNPMQKQGAIVLGSGGDCCYSNNNASQGTFYEGAIVAGYPSDATDDAIQANVVSTGYGK